MKKKILSLILVLMLLPIASLFVACGKDKGYNLNSLDDDFNQIVEANSNIKNVDGKFVFDYSTHNNLSSVISNNAPYKELERYNYVFYNLMSFSYNYVQPCSNNGLTDNVQIKNQIEKDLIALKKSINDVNECVNMFAETIIVSNNISAPVCITSFENLITMYEYMFEKATNFNNSLSDLYFNYALKDGNPDVYSIGEINFDANIVVNKFRSRVFCQISNLSSSFVEMYVDGNLAKKIANKETTFDLTKYNYKNNVDAILNATTENFKEVEAVEKANHTNHKSTFFELSVQAQNIQATLNNDRKKFITACNNIDYSVIKDDAKASAYDKLCVSIIESNYDLICNYNNVLVNMLNIMLSTGA